MDLSKPGTRWAIFGVVLVAIAIATVGVVGSTQPERVAATYTATCPYGGYTPGLNCTPGSQYTGTDYPQNGSLFAPEHSRYWYLAGGAVLVIGLLGAWAASASRNKPSGS